MAHLHFTDIALSGHPVEVDGACLDVAKANGPEQSTDLVDGIPFILGDDGTYDLDLNRFFRECPSIGVRSLNSIRAYARDLVTWIRFWRNGAAAKALGRLAARI